MQALTTPNVLQRLRLASSVDDSTAGAIAGMLRCNSTLQDLVRPPTVRGGRALWQAGQAARFPLAMPASQACRRGGGHSVTSS